MTETTNKKIFITAALPFCNSNPHLGNLIGSTLSADIYARVQRKLGHNVMFICGTDDYGSQTEHKALQERLSNKAICDKYRIGHEQIYNWFNLSFDVFGKTSTDTHTAITQQMLTKIYENGFLHEKITQQHFCEQCDRFVCDRFIHGVCYTENCNGIVKGDECDSCSKMLDIEKITKKWCSICKTTPIKKETKHLFFDLAPYKDQLIGYFLNQTNCGIKYASPAATRVTKEWLSKDLTDRSVTRDLVWGVPFPTFENLTDYDNKISWPWFDAPYGYISILANAHPETWRNWINSSTDWIQFMAKDNVPFHTVIFPASLIASNFGGALIGATHLPATEYLLFNGEKFSKSGGIGIFGDQVITMSKTLGIDEDYWRYYLCKIRPENGDSTFTFEGFCDVIKGELAQKMGNLVNRGIVMQKKYYPRVNTALIQTINYDLLSHPILQTKLLSQITNYLEAFERFSYHEAINAINRIAEIGNEWINEQTLWIVCKNTPVESEHLMGNLLFIIWLFSEFIEPIMPKKASVIKSYFAPTNNTVYNTFNQIIQIVTKGTGTMNVYHTKDHAQILFKQIKIEDVLSLN